MNDRVQAAEVLASHAGDAPWVAHCRAVARAAEAIGSALTAAQSVDVDLLWSTALLHDIGRSVTHDPVLHGVEGYRLLSGMGHDEAAYVCASHVLFGLNAAEAIECGLPARDFIPRTLEQRIVPLADFLINVDRPTTLQQRFESLRARNESNPWFLARLDRAHAVSIAFMEQLEEQLDGSIETLVARFAGCS
ncbi:MAG: HD domain-containing protein [Coriobacteriia bacterium]